MKGFFAAVVGALTIAGEAQAWSLYVHEFIAWEAMRILEAWGDSTTPYFLGQAMTFKGESYFKREQAQMDRGIRYTIIR